MNINSDQILRASFGERVTIQSGYVLFRARHGGWHTTAPEKGHLTGFDAGEDDQHWRAGHYSAVGVDPRTQEELLVSDEELYLALARGENLNVGPEVSDVQRVIEEAAIRLAASSSVLAAHQEP